MSEADGAPDVTDTVDMSEEAAAVKIQAMQRGKQARREHEELLRVKAAFEKFDTDGSGSLEIAELYDVLKEVGVDIDTDTFADYQLALMEDYDADDSGALDFREFRKFYEQVLANESTRKAYARELDAAVKGLVSSALGNVIERQFKSANDWPFGAALSFLLMYATFGALALRAVFSRQSGMQA